MATPKKTPPATKAPAPTTTVAELQERFKDYPAIDVVSRRMLDPTEPGSLPILLKDEADVCCVNTDHQRRLKRNAVTCHLCQLPVRLWHLHYCNGAIDG